MGKEVQKSKRAELRFNEDEFKLVLSMIEKMEKPLELMYYFLNKGINHSFVIMLISASEVEIRKLLINQKRDTDILFSIDKTQNLFALLCQETKVDGAYRFAERILKALADQDAKDIYCAEIEVRSTKYEIKELMMKAIEKYMVVKKEKREKEILFYSM